MAVIENDLMAGFENDCEATGRATAAIERKERKTAAILVETVIDFDVTGLDGLKRVPD